MSIFPHMGWAHALMGMSVVLGIACYFAARWETRYLAQNFKSSNDQQFANTSRRSYVSPRGIT